MKTKKIPFVFAVVAVILFFLTQRAIAPTIYYTFLAAGLAIYFFPVKLIWELFENKNKGFKKVIVVIISNWLYSAALCMSATLLYYPEASFLPVIGLANGVTGLVYFLFSIDDEKAMLHFILAALL
ncbi:MAG: hypothetical protein LBB31_00985 [Prevotellaceae bacterium]|jgi:hypothetical protein|nr:hypothetical protein [Prevotellaceae bacterium]